MPKVLKKFVDTNHCNVQVHCKVCRDLEGGRYWRLMLAQCYSLPNDEVDFACPLGRPWGYIDSLQKQKSKEQTSSGGKNYALSHETRTKLQKVFLGFRTACYQHRSVQNCDCELRKMGGCGLKSILKTKGRLPCVKEHFPAVEIDEQFRQQLNGCEED